MAVICGERIKELREKLGFTQPELAEKIGLSLSSIRFYELGKVDPSLETICKMADYFQVSVDYLLNRADEKDDDVDLKDLQCMEYNMYLKDYKKYAAGNIVEFPKYKPMYPYNLLTAVSNELWDEALTEDQENGLAYAISKLSTREQTCIIHYFKEEKNLEQCGRIYNVTRERVRQILAKALRKLRNPIRYKYIRYGLVGSEIEGAIRKEKERYDHLRELLDSNNNMETGLEVQGIPYELPDGKGYTGWLSLEKLDFSVRTYNCLKRWRLQEDGHEIDNIYDLTGVTEKELLNCRNLGRRSVDEIKNKLAEYNLSLREEVTA